MTSLTEDFFMSYYTVFPFTYKMFLNHTNINSMVRGEKGMLLAFYDYKNKMHELPHYTITKHDIESTVKDIRQVRINVVD